MPDAPAFRWSCEITAGSYFENSFRGALPVPTRMYTLVPLSAELRTQAREGAIFDKWVVMADFLPLMLYATPRRVLKNRL